MYVCDVVVWFYFNFFMKKSFSIIVAILFFTKIVAAQDIHLSQFFASPLTLNAANTGNFDGQFRVMSNFRSESISSVFNYATPAAILMVSADYNLLKRKKNFFGVGLVVINDASGYGVITSNKIYFSTAYHIHFGNADTPKHYLHIGLQAGLVNKSVDIVSLTFQAQYNAATGEINPEMPNGEGELTNTSFTYLDFNVGVAWSSFFSKKFSVQGGINLTHIGKPNESFYTNRNSIVPIGAMFHVISQIKCSDRIILSPTILFTNSKANNKLTFGSSLNYAFKYFTVYGGTFYRTDKATIGLVGFQFKKIRAGFSYDIYVSTLSATHYQDALEFSLAYCPYKTNRKIYFYPKD